MRHPRSYPSSLDIQFIERLLSWLPGENKLFAETLIGRNERPLGLILK